MKKIFFTSIFIVGMTAISGCVTATSNYKAPENIAAYKGKTDFYMEQYMSCLAKNGGIHLKRGYKNAPTKSFIKSACLEKEEELYKAAYVDSYGDQEVSPNWRSSTAKALIRETDSMIMGR